MWKTGKNLRHTVYFIGVPTQNALQWKDTINTSLKSTLLLFNGATCDSVDK